MYPADTQFESRKARTTRIKGVAGDAVCTEIGYTTAFKWGAIMVGLPGTIVSMTKAQESYDVTFDNHESVFYLRERDGDRVFHAHANDGGVYELIQVAGERGNTEYLVAFAHRGVGATTRESRASCVHEANSHFPVPTASGVLLRWDVNQDDMMRAEEECHSCWNRDEDAATIFFSHRRGHFRDLPPIDRAKLLHEALNHRVYPQIAKEVQAGHYSHFQLTKEDLLAAHKLGCEGCSEGRSGIIHHVPRQVPLATEPGSVFHCDVTYVGKKRYLTIVDGSELFVIASPLSSRRTEELRNGMVAASTYFRNRGWKPERTLFLWDGELGAAMGEVAKLLIPGLELRFVGGGQHNKVVEAVTKQLRDAMRICYLAHPYALSYTLLPQLFEWCVQGYNLITNAATGTERTRWEIVNRKSSDGAMLAVGFGVAVMVRELERTSHQAAHHSKNRIGLVVARECETSQFTIQCLDDGLGQVRRDDLLMVPISPSLIDAVNKWGESSPLVRLTDLLRLESQRHIPISATLGQPMEEPTWTEEAIAALPEADSSTGQEAEGVEILMDGEPEAKKEEEGEETERVRAAAQQILVDSLEEVNLPSLATVSNRPGLRSAEERRTPSRFAFLVEVAEHYEEENELESFETSIMWGEATDEETSFGKRSVCNKSKDEPILNIFNPQANVHI